ncbi:MAG: hypothetical protein IKM82_06150 [Oscillospiraceae bacterium]|nr:hypothetical protein [Oscillospiraceae bacterium]
MPKAERDSLCFLLSFLLRPFPKETSDLHEKSLLGSYQRFQHIKFAAFYILGIIQIPPSAPYCATKKDVAQKNPETSTVSGFFYVQF